MASPERSLTTTDDGGVRESTKGSSDLSQNHSQAPDISILAIKFFFESHLLVLSEAGVSHQNKGQIQIRAWYFSPTQRSVEQRSGPKLNPNNRVGIWQTKPSFNLTDENESITAALESSD